MLQNSLPYKTRSTMIVKYTTWFINNKIKAFYNIVDEANFQNGATSLLQVGGIGKLRPNILMIGYKQDWTTCPRNDLIMYFNVIQ